jgi:cyclic beta-1,2-glucan synthetase
LVKDRRTFPGLLRLPARLAVLSYLALLAAPGTGAAAPADGGPIRLSDAAQRGAFNVGAARANVNVVPDPAAGGDVLKLDYTLPRGTAAGVWAKAFPEGLSPDRIDVVDLGVRAAEPDQARHVAVKVEIKGTAGTQSIPVPLQPGWARREAAVDWPRVGSVQEIVVVVERTGDAESVAGTLDLDVRFGRLTLLRQLSTHPAARIGGVLLVSLLGALVTALLGVVIGRLREPAAGPGGLWRDFVLGVGVVGIAVLVVGIYLLGEREQLEIGWTALGFAVAGAVLAEWLKFGLTGKHLTPGEVFRDMLATGLPAASASPLAILQAPAGWSDLLLLSQTVAAATALVYHVANAYRLSSLGRHLGPVGAALIVGTPYVVGGLLLLRSPALLQTLGGDLTAGALGAWPAAVTFIGRVAVVFCFNEAVANGLSLATRRTLLRPLTAHLTLLAVAAAVIVAPRVAAFGSGTEVTSWPAEWRLVAAVLTTMLSQAPLWAEVYLITGMVLDAIHGRPPSEGSAVGLPLQGAKKGVIFSGVFMAVVYVPGTLWLVPAVRWLAENYTLPVVTLFGALTFPLVKTVIETFDGSQAFFRRVGKSYRNPVLYARGAVVGLGVGYAITTAMSQDPTPDRVWFGLVVGVAAFAGVNLLRDYVYALRGQGRPQSWRVYLVQSLLGGFVGAAIGFYFDAAQVAAVAEKFQLYLSAGAEPKPFDVYPLLSKWGFINLGTVTGGVSLLFAESLAGVIQWSIPAWLFAINRTFLAAYFRKETTPIKALFTADGLAQLTQNMIEVLRWGLWMSPIINTFLRPMGEPTWYNQDGAVRTVVATVQDIRLSPDAFRAWSLQVFIWLLAYDWVRILIWLDHFGLRVATLVNLSFLGMDRLDERLSRFLAPAATALCIPEAVKRFTTWAPLVIPFYIPRGADWDYAWSQHEILRRAAGPGPLATLLALPLPTQLLLVAGAVVASTALFTAVRWVRGRSGPHRPPDRSLANTVYEVELAGSGAVSSRTRERGYDVTRRSYDLIDPAGRALFLVDAGQGRAWPVIGNYPAALGGESHTEQDERSLRVITTRDGLRATVEISLPAAGDPVELWTVTVENLSDVPRRVRVVPYLEWVLNRPDADRGHTQYNRLFAEMEYVRGLNAILAWDKHSKAAGLLAADAAPEGFLTARVDFIGRARSVWSPRALETLAFTPAEDTPAHPTLDPIASLLLSLTLPAHGSSSVRLLIGLTADKKQAIDLIARHLNRTEGKGLRTEAQGLSPVRPIGHGEVPPGTPQPYSEFSEDGRRLLVHTPFTPRPYDHVLSNARGHVVAVTNRGLHTTSSVNSQQNRLTPDWADTVTREVPGEAIYLYDPDRGEWFSPTYHPLNDPGASHEAEFGVDGTATFRLTKGDLETELTVFVPPEDPTGVYLLTVRNHSGAPRRLRLAPYFQMVLAGQPEYSGPLTTRHDPALGALFFENPRNTFRTGPAFAAMSLPAERVETNRGRFFGAGRGVARPALVERAEPDAAGAGDDRPVAAFLTTIEVPAHGEATAVIVLGQADDRQQAEAVVRKYRSADAARAALRETRRWWLSLMDTVRAQTSSPELDHYLDWLKYQALAERIWARRGFYQASGAFGFRDQLQDSVNLIWADPVIARRQILLHAAQQFLEGDVVHWFHRLQDGRTGFSGRTHASDNLLWLAWGVVEYVGATGDHSILDERTPYLEAEQFFEPLPAGKHGMGFDPLRSAREDSVYRHCLKAIDLVLDKRMGAHGLPLIGTGDWNDGLDEIGSQGRGESVWLGLFLAYILERMAPIVGKREGVEREEYYRGRLRDLRDAIERTWRGDRYLRAIHDDGTEIGVKGSGVWEIDALTAAWAVMAGVNPERGRAVFDTAVSTLERETTILLGWPPLREDTKPYLGRSSWYPEGVRENGMYCHGVQWLVGAARILAERFERAGEPEEARRYRETAYRLWLKVSPIPHVAPGEVETYGGQPNKQAADMVTTFDPGRMIWHGYTGAAGWVFRQALEGVLGLRLVGGELVAPADLAPAGDLTLVRVIRDVARSPFEGPQELRPPVRQVVSEQAAHLTEP